jgi:ribosomal-protein-alanine N-acetyltransferase
VLRRWREEDVEPFAELNADPLVMEHFPATLPRARTEELVSVIELLFDEHGYGLWALEVRDTGTMIGFTGLVPVLFEAPFTPAVEVGWRLARGAWGHGYATEAASAALAHGFEEAGLEEVVATTATTNERSMAVMRRLGMRRDPADDFDHPRIPAEHRLSRHVLYRLRAADWRG